MGYYGQIYISRGLEENANNDALNHLKRELKSVGYKSKIDSSNQYSSVRIILAEEERWSGPLSGDARGIWNRTRIPLSLEVITNWEAAVRKVGLKFEQGSGWELGIRESR